MADTIPLHTLVPSEVGFNLPPERNFSPTRGLIDKLSLSFPDKHPRKKVTEYDLGYQAGAIEVIRRLKEETGYG